MFRLTCMSSRTDQFSIDIHNSSNCKNGVPMIVEVGAHLGKEKEFNTRKLVGVC